MALVIFHISVVALHHIRLILALVFLPRIPLRTSPLGQKEIGNHFTGGNASKSVRGSHGFLTEERIGVATLESVADGPPPRNLASLMTNIRHAGKPNKRLLISDHPESNVDFSIYADASSPKPTKVNLIASIAPEYLYSAMDDLSALRAASDRVSEILRESRRRLDAGEDSSAIRREAHRKRAQELMSVRGQGANFVG